MKLLDLLTQEKIIAIIRGISPNAADKTVEALTQGGVKLLEVTTNTEGALDMLSRWREKYAGQVRVGMGTVLNLPMAKDAVSAGAEFLISPNLDEAVIAYGLEQGIEVWPGTMTPTEIIRAWNAGAKAVKVFPMGSLGLSYLKEIRAPLDHIPMIATGGVTLDNIADFLKAGAIGVGLGSNLVDKELVRDGKYDQLTLLVQRFVQAAKG